MRTRTANWFVCKVRYEKVMEDGLQKKVTENYVVDALSFSEAEARIIDSMKEYISGEFKVVNIDPAVFGEVFFSEDNPSEYICDWSWYKCKVQFITIDEKTEREKKSNVYYLVQGENLENARKNIDEVMGGTMIDYVIASVSETNYIDVFEYFTKKEENHE